MTIKDYLESLVSRAELAKELHVTERTIGRYETLPDGLPSMLIGGKKKYRMDSVIAWLEGRERRRNQRRKAA